MFRTIYAALGTAQNKLGFTWIACDCGCIHPDDMAHIWSEEPDDVEDPADCGEIGNEWDSGPLCPECADIHADQPWIRRLERFEH